MPDFANMNWEELLRPQGHACACGKHHACELRNLFVGRGAVLRTPEALRSAGIHKPFVVCDERTRAAAGNAVEAALKDAGVPYALYQLSGASVEPDERAVGSLTMALPPDCDGVLAVGSGVINDCCKVLSHAARLPQIVVATAPSMDGYASASSSMIRDRVKVSLHNACPVSIVADTLILSRAPERMLWAGLGDMLAKYVALCEWRISHLVTGEYDCPDVAALVRASLKRVSDAAGRLMAREPEAVGAVAEGLVLSGVAMAFAGISRPASGLEHYFSHLWEMMSLDRGLPCELHGVQVGVGTVLTLRLYDRIRALRPGDWNPDALAFDEAAWERNVRRVFGAAAPAVLQSARREGRNDAATRRAHARTLSEHWDEVLRIIGEELPPTAQVVSLMRGVGMPVEPEEIGIGPQDVQDAFVYSRDIRDKYLTSTMLWDMGLLERFAQERAYAAG